MNTYPNSTYKMKNILLIIIIESLEIEYSVDKENKTHRNVQHEYFH